MADLRERKKQATRRRIAAEALRLFVEQGYAAATMERIAAAADVSPRTVFRYYPTKADLVFHHEHTWMEIFEAEAADRPPDEKAAAMLRRVSHRIADHIEADPTPVITAIGVVAKSPELRSREAALNWRWVDLVAASVADHSVGAFAARVAGAAVMGMIATVVSEWVQTYPDSDMHELIDEGFDLLSAGLEAFFVAR